jgi:hypothetical protein
MAGFIFLIIGLVCALIGRILLLGAAFGISVWWGLGVLLPFGPLFFRLSYPETAERSRIFRLAALPCLFLYLTLGSGISPTAYYRHKIKRTQPPADFPPQYALEVTNRSAKNALAEPGPKVETSPALEERRDMNRREFERLRAWGEALRLRKRDLLHSDTEGNRLFNLEMAHYNEALEKANAEKTALELVAR